MKRLNQAYLSMPQAAKINKTALASFSEEDILALQDSLFTPGFHIVGFKNRESGHKVLAAFLKFLDCSRVACLSCYSLPDYLTNIYQEITHAHIEEYLVNCFYYDVLIIEVTPELLVQSWFFQLERLLVEFNYTSSLSVVCCIYQELVK